MNEGQIGQLPQPSHFCLVHTCRSLYVDAAGREPPVSLSQDLDAELAVCMRAVELEYLLAKGNGWDQVSGGRGGGGKFLAPVSSKSHNSFCPPLPHRTPLPFPLPVVPSARSRTGRTLCLEARSSDWPWPGSCTTAQLSLCWTSAPVLYQQTGRSNCTRWGRMCERPIHSLIDSLLP